MPKPQSEAGAKRPRNITVILDDGKQVDTPLDVQRGGVPPKFGLRAAAAALRLQQESPKARRRREAAEAAAAREQEATAEAAAAREREAAAARERDEKVARAALDAAAALRRLRGTRRPSVFPASLQRQLEALQADRRREAAAARRQREAAAREQEEADRRRREAAAEAAVEAVAAEAARQRAELERPLEGLNIATCDQILARLNPIETHWKVVCADTFNNLVGQFDRNLVERCIWQKGYIRLEFPLEGLRAFLNTLKEHEKEVKAISQEHYQTILTNISSNATISTNEQQRKKTMFEEIAGTLQFHIGTTIDDTDKLDEELSRASTVPDGEPVAEGRDIFSDRAHERSLASITIDPRQNPSEYAEIANKKLKAQRKIMNGERQLCKKDDKVIFTSDGNPRYCFVRKPETVGSSKFQLQARQDMAVHRFIQYCAHEKGILLVHSVGTGKTITSLTMALNSFSWNDDETGGAGVSPFIRNKQTGTYVPNENYKWRKIVLVVPGSLFRNFQEELKVNIPNITELTEINYFTPQETLVTPLAKIRAKFNGNYFTMIGYKYGSINQKYESLPLADKGNIENVFKDAVVVFDEAHRLFRSVKEGGKETTLDLFLTHRYLLQSKRYILMTGTPYSKNLSDTIALLRLFDCNSRSCPAPPGSPEGTPGPITCEQVTQCIQPGKPDSSKFFIDNYGNYWGPISMVGQYTPEQQLYFANTLFGKFLQLLDLIPYDLLWKVEAGPVSIPIGKGIADLFQNCKQLLENRRQYRATLFDSFFGDELEPTLFYFQALQEGKSIAYAQQKMWERAEKQAKILAVGVIPGAAAGAYVGIKVFQLAAGLASYIGSFIVGYLPQTILNVIAAIAIFKPAVVAAAVAGGAYIGIKAAVKILQWFKVQPELPKALVELVAKILIAKPSEQDKLLRKARQAHPGGEEAPQRLNNRSREALQREGYVVEGIAESNLPPDVLEALAAVNAQSGGLFGFGSNKNEKENKGEEEEEEEEEEQFKAKSAKIPVSYEKIMEAYKYFNANERTPFANIKQKFRRLALSKHPNKGGKTEEWTPIQDAFSLLTLLEKGRVEVIEERQSSTTIQVKHDIYTNLVKAFPNEDERTTMLRSLTEVLVSDKFKGYIEKNSREYESLSKLLKNDSTFGHLVDFSMEEIRKKYSNKTGDEIFESISVDIDKKDFSLEYLEDSIKAGAVLDESPSTPVAPPLLKGGAPNNVSIPNEIEKNSEYVVSQKNSSPEMYTSLLENDDTPIELASDDLLNILTKELDFVYEDYPYLLDSVIPAFSIDCATREGYSKSKAIVEFLGGAGIMNKYEAAQKFLTDEEKRAIENTTPAIQTGGATLESIQKYIETIQSIEVRFGELDKAYKALKQPTDWFTKGIEALNSIKNGLEILKSIPEHSRPTHKFSEVGIAIQRGIGILNELEKNTYTSLTPGIDYVNQAVEAVLEEAKADTGNDISPITLTQFNQTKDMQKEILKMFYSSLQKFIFHMRAMVDEHLSPPSEVVQLGGFDFSVLRGIINPDVLQALQDRGVAAIAELNPQQAQDVLRAGAEHLSPDVVRQFVARVNPEQALEILRASAARLSPGALRELAARVNPEQALEILRAGATHLSPGALRELAARASINLTPEQARELLNPIVEGIRARGANFAQFAFDAVSILGKSGIWEQIKNLNPVDLFNYFTGNIMAIYTYDFYNGISIQTIVNKATMASRMWQIASSVGTAFTVKKTFDRFGWSNVGTAVASTIVVSTVGAFSWPASIAFGIAMYLSRKAKSSGNITPLEVRVKNWFDKINNVGYKVNFQKFSNDSKQYISIFDVAQDEIIPKFSGTLLTHKIENPEYQEDRNAAQGEPYEKVSIGSIIKYRKNPAYKPALKEKFIDNSGNINSDGNIKIYKLPGYKNLNFSTIYDIFKHANGKDKDNSLVKKRNIFKYPQKIVEFIYIPYTIEQQIELTQVSNNEILAADRWYFQKTQTKPGGQEAMRNPTRRAMGNYSLDMKNLWADFIKQDYYPYYAMKDPIKGTTYPIRETDVLNRLYKNTELPTTPSRHGIPFREIKFDCPKFRHMLMNLLLMKTGKVFTSRGLHYQPHLRDLSGSKNLVNKYKYPIEFGQHDYDMEDFPSFIEPIANANRATHYYLPLVYSTSDVLGLGPFALYLESLGFRYILLHDSSEKSTIDREQMRALQKCYPLQGTVEVTAQQQDVDGNPRHDMLGKTLYETQVRYDKDGERKRQELENSLISMLTKSPNTDSFREELERLVNTVDKKAPLCVLLHPDITEGVDAKHNPAILLMEPPHNFGDYEQLCGRVLRTYKLGYKVRPKKIVYQYAAYDKEKLKEIYDKRFNPTIKGVIGGIDAERRSFEGEEYFYTEGYDVDDGIFIALEKEKEELASYLPNNPFWVALRAILVGNLDYFSDLPAERKREEERKLDELFRGVKTKLTKTWMEWLFSGSPVEEKVKEGAAEAREDILDPTLLKFFQVYLSGSFASLPWTKRFKLLAFTALGFTGRYRKEIVYINELIKQRVAKISQLNSNLVKLIQLEGPLVQAEGQATAQVAHQQQRVAGISPQEQTMIKENLTNLDKAIKELNNIMIVNDNPDITKITEIATCENEVKQYMKVMMEDKTPDITAIQKCLKTRGEKVNYPKIIWCDPFAKPIQQNKYILCRPIDSMEDITIDTDSKFIQFTQLVDIMKEFIDQFKPYPYYQNKPIQTLEVFNTLLEKFNSYVYSYFLGEPKNDYKYLDAGNPPPEKVKIAYKLERNRTAWNTYVKAMGNAITTGGGNRKTRSVKHKKYRTTRRKGKVRNRLTRRK